jgi:cytoskeletal protein RodZ
MKKQVLQAKQLQAEALVQVGLKLTHAREQREFSVEDLALKTHIPARLLNAIETGDMSHLPEPVYVQSFIRQYANAMGLNGVQIASEFPVEPVVRPPKKPLFQFSGWQLRPIHLYGAYMLMILGAIQGLSFVMNRSASQLAPASATLQNTTPVPTTPGVGPMPKPVATIAPSNNNLITNQPAAKPDPTAKPVRVALTTTDSSWVELIVDGKSEFEGMLNSGDQRVLAANQRVTIKTGNAGAVVAKFNEGEAKPLGALGSVEEVSFPPEAKDVAGVNSTKMAKNDGQ